mmetsp:Transcript_19315/g.39947  ORF Transcript_19315/g.39947 Transcript_19315/m.39947 type:complete len:195 (-) Transcript_19315:65-649(-)
MSSPPPPVAVNPPSLPTLSPTGHYLTLDPPLKQYILHLHKLITSPLPSTPALLRTKLSPKWHDSRSALLRSYLSSEPERWKRCDEVFRTRYKQVSAGYDDLVTGALDCLDVKDEEGGVLQDVFDFVVDGVQDSEEGVVVTLQSLQGVVEVVAAFNEENVWTKVGEEKVEVKEKVKRGGRKQKKTFEEEMDEWDY